MNSREFITLVREMRKAQRAREQTGQTSDYERARLLEKQVDNASVKDEAEAAETKSLFE